MIKVIIFGLFTNRLGIERILDDNVEVIGYSDIGPIVDNFKSYENKPFYNLSELKTVKFDYILICNNKKDMTLLLENILYQNGIPKNKIIPTFCLKFKESSFQSTYDEFIQLNKSFEGAIFGMSYSRRGLIPELLDRDFYKFSLNGMDLHANKLYIENLIENSPFFPMTKYVILELPYYIFNWDICSSNQIYFRINMFDEFNDWGDFKNKNDSELYIEQWHSLKMLVGKKFESNQSVLSNSYMFSDMIKKESENYTIQSVWTKTHPETIKKNCYYFYDICDFFKQINAKVFIVVFPFSPTFVKKNKEIIQKNKEDFYQIINSGKKILDNIEVIDFIQKPYAKFLDTFFFEPTHLNLHGAIQMSKTLNLEIEKRINHLTENILSTKDDSCKILYSTYISGVSWMPWVENGEESGLSSKYQGLRGIKIIIKNKDSNEMKISYAVYSKASGWTPYMSDGTAAIGQNGDKISGLRIFLDEETSKSYNVKYSVYLFGTGWTEWKYNNQIAGGYESQIEGVRIMLCKK